MASRAAKVARPQGLPVVCGGALYTREPSRLPVSMRASASCWAASTSPVRVVAVPTRDRDLHRLDRRLVGNGLLDARDDGGRDGLVGIDEEDRELVPADAGDEVGLAHRRGRDVREGTQQPVARVVAESVVGLLQRAAVELNDADRSGVAGHLGQCFVPGEAVRQPRQRVAARLLGGPLEILAQAVTRQSRREQRHRRLDEALAE